MNFWKTKKRKIIYFLKHWKIGIHLVLQTKRFGVNNKWWSKYDGIMGVSTLRILWNLIRIYPIIRNYKLMKFRAIKLGFLSIKECMILWPQDTIEEWGKEAVKAFLKLETLGTEANG